MAEVRRTLTLSMLGVSLFGMGLLGGLGACAAGKAAMAAKVRDSTTATAQQRDEAAVLQSASIASSVFFFAGLLGFMTMLMLATYK